MFIEGLDRNFLFLRVHVRFWCQSYTGFIECIILSLFFFFGGVILILYISNIFGIIYQ